MCVYCKSHFSSFHSAKLSTPFYHTEIHNSKSESVISLIPILGMKLIIMVTVRGTVSIEAGRDSREQSFVLSSSILHEYSIQLLSMTTLLRVLD